jgi:hypothetical protein
MSVRLAHIANEAHRLWRLRLDPDATGTGDKAGDLISFSGDIHHPEDELKMTMLLSASGFRPVPGGWQDQDGTWLVPVVRLE